jgi:cytochrome P450
VGAENSSVVLAPYGMEWRERRAMLHQLMTRKSITQFHGALWEACLRMLADALENPLTFGGRLRL